MAGSYSGLLDLRIGPAFEAASLESLEEGVRMQGRSPNLEATERRPRLTRVGHRPPEQAEGDL